MSEAFNKWCASVKDCGYEVQINSPTAKQRRLGWDAALASLSAAAQNALRDAGYIIVKNSPENAGRGLLNSANPKTGTSLRGKKIKKSSLDSMEIDITSPMDLNTCISNAIMRGGYSFKILEGKKRDMRVMAMMEELRGSLYDEFKRLLNAVVLAKKENAIRGMEQLKCSLRNGGAINAVRECIDIMKSI